MLPRLLYLKDFQIKWQLKTSYCLKGIEGGCASLHSHTKDIGQFMLSANAKSRFLRLLFKFKLKIGVITRVFSIFYIPSLVEICWFPGDPCIWNILERVQLAKLNRDLCMSFSQKLCPFAVFLNYSERQLLDTIVEVATEAVSECIVII